MTVFWDHAHGLVGDGANGSGQDPYPSAGSAALRAVGLLGSAVDRYDEGLGCVYVRAHSGVLVKRSCFNPIQQDASPIFQA
jgi:hypothetical protein